MSSVVLTILGDNRGARRAIAEARADYARAADAITGESRRAATARARIEAEEIAQARRDLRDMHNARVRDLQARQRAEATAARARAQAERQELAAQRAAEREKTRTATRESALRTRLAKREAAEAAAAEREKTAEAEREEKRRTRLAEQEAKKRARADRRAQREAEREMGQIASRVGRVASAVASGVTGYAGAMHGQIQGARERRADTERTLGSALYQAGADRSDVQSAMQRFTRFAAENGIESRELAEAANAAQTEFSVFGDRNTGSANRNTRIGAFLRTALLARNTGNNIGEFGRLEGLFQQQGFDDATRRSLLLYTAGAAQRGAVETGTITRQAMPAITARLGMAMAAARANGANPQAAAVQEYRQALAELEVARGTEGATPRQAGNAIAQITNRLQGRVTQDKLLDNIRNSLGRRSALESQLYEADPTRHGHQRLRAQYTNALELVSAFGARGMTAAQFQNVTGGGGHGNPMSMLQNERRVLGNLLNIDAEGKSGVSRIRELMRPDAALTDADVARGERVFGRDAKAELNRSAEAHDNALADNTSALVRLSNRLADWSTRNPFASQGLSSGAGVASALGGGVGAAVMQGAAVRLLGGAAPRAAALLGGAGSGAGLGLAGAALPAVAAVTAGALANGAIDAGNAWAGRQRMIDRNRREAGAAFGATEDTSTLPRISLDDASVARLAAAMRAAQITATVSPHDAAHAASQSAAGRGS